MLRFLSHLLRNATSKSVFNSVPELSALLASRDDGISALAVEALASPAQLELCGELADLVRPTVSGEKVGGGGLAGLAMTALADSPAVPYRIRTLAVEALAALVARRDGATGAVAGVARQTNVLAELGVGKGQHLGLLPTLIRRSLAALCTVVFHQHDACRPLRARPSF